MFSAVNLVYFLYSEKIFFLHFLRKSRKLLIILKCFFLIKALSLGLTLLDSEFMPVGTWFRNAKYMWETERCCLALGGSRLQIPVFRLRVQSPSGILTETWPQKRKK